MASLFGMYAALVLAVPAWRPAEATIVTSTIRSYEGFRAELTWQIGCATTRHIPTAKEEADARAGQAKLIARNAPALRAAYAHYARGKHPYTEHRRWLRKSKTGGAVSTRPIRLRNIHVRLFIAPETPEIIRHKIRLDFILAQMFPGGDLHGRNGPHRTFKHMGKRSLTRVITHYLYSGSELESVLLAAIHDPGGLHDANLARPNSISSIRTAWRARVFGKILKGESPGAKIISDMPGYDSFADAQFIMLTTPAFSRAEKAAMRRVLARKGTDRGKVLLKLYAPLLN